MASEKVRQRLPPRMRQLQRQLWEGADAKSALGKVSVERVLSLQHQLQTVQGNQAALEQVFVSEHYRL